MKKLIILLFTFISYSSFATHIVSGNIHCEYIRTLSNGLESYKLSVNLVRDCLNGQVDLDPTIEIGIYINTSGFPIYRRQTINLINKFKSDVTQCLNPDVQSTIQGNLCFEQGVYETTFLLDPSPVGYTITFDRCCRNTMKNIISNQQAPDQGVHLRTTVSGTNTFSNYNLNNYTPKVIAVNDTAQILIDEQETDADSVVIELSSALAGVSSMANIIPRPLDSLGEPVLIRYVNSYSSTHPLGRANGAFITKENNGYRLMASEPGFYLVAFSVKKYKNGRVSLETTREIVLQALTLPANPFSQDNTPRNFDVKYDPQRAGVLSWENCLDEVQRYDIYRSEAGSGFSLLDSTAPSVKGYRDESITTQVNYKYFVQGIPRSGFVSGNTDTLSLYSYGLSVGEREASKLRIFPNPASGRITVSYYSDISVVTICTLLGKEIKRKENIYSQEAEISLAGVQSGFYILTVENTEGTSSHKILVE